MVSIANHHVLSHAPFVSFHACRVCLFCFVRAAGVETRGLLYTAASGEGTFVRALSAGADDSRRVFVDHARKPCDTRVLESVEAGHTSHAVAAQVCSDLGITLPPIRVDGQCKYGLLSEGQVSRPVRVFCCLACVCLCQPVVYLWVVRRKGLSVTPPLPVPCVPGSV